MRQFDRIYRLYQVIRARRHPVSLAVLRERLECSESTVKRAIRDLRALAAPLEYDLRRGGYYFDDGGGDDGDGGRYELPGLWFNERELRGLLVIHQVLHELHSDLLETHLAPLRARIEALLARGAPSAEALRRRVRVPAIGAREVDAETFRAVSSALFSRRRLRVRYRARSSGDASERTLSPQRLVHYRNNWYLDAWCHLRRGLRSFSLDRLQVLGALTDAAREVADAKLDASLGASYGIFAGRPRAVAKIRFSHAAAAWVAHERWHPAQRGAWRADGYELEVPYSNPSELVMDILRHGADAEVLAPPQLRRIVRERLDAARRNYSRGE
ncbi:MAG: helix-turn-helix transcriptional regulator [bacterium]